MVKHLLSSLAFMVVSFAVQGSSHLAINKAHYDSVDFTRSEPLIPLGLLVMALQGGIISLVLSRIAEDRVAIRDGITTSIAFGLFLVAYIAIAEPAKYAVPSIPVWFTTEALSGLIQFTVYGVVLGFIHQKLGNAHGD